MPLLPTIATTSTPCRTSASKSPSAKPIAPSPSSSTTCRSGCASRGRERVARAHAEAAVRPGIEERARLVAVDELARVRHEVAAVADHDRVAVEPLAQLAVDARRLDRRACRRRATAASAARFACSSSRSCAIQSSCAPGGAPGVGERGERRRAGRRPSTPRASACARDLARARRTGARPARRRTGRSRAGSRAACRRRARGRLPSARPTAARENASSWSAGSVPRPMPLTNTGTRAASANATQRVLGVRPVHVAARDQHRPLAPTPTSVATACTSRRDRASAPRARPDRPPGSRRSPGRTRRAGCRRTSGPRCGVRAATARRVDLVDDRRRRRRGRGALRDRRDDRHVVELLQRARAPAPLRRAAAEHDHRRAVHAAPRSSRSTPLVTPGPGGERRATEPARHLGPALGRERRGLLVAGVDEPQVGLHRAVVEHEEVPARQREHHVDAVAPQHLDREPAAVRLHDQLPRRRRARREERRAARRSTRRGSRTAASDPRPGSRRARRPGSLRPSRATRRGTAASCSPTMTSVGHATRGQRGEVVGLVRDRDARARPTSPPRASSHFRSSNSW